MIVNRISFTLLSLAVSLTILNGCDSQIAKTTAKTTAETTAEVKVTLTLEERLDQPVSEKRCEVSKESIQLSEGDAGLYTVFIPADYDERKPVPLVLYLHDGGGVRSTAPHYGNMSLNGFVEPALQELGAILVAPDSGPSNWSSERNQDFVSKLIKTITESYEIDTDRTLITGFSMGGHGTWFHAEAHEDFFRAAIPIAGSPRTEKTNWKTKLYVIHSEDDTTVPLAPTKKYIAKLKENNVDVGSDILSGYGHFEIPRYVTPLQNAVSWIEDAWLEAGTRLP